MIIPFLPLFYINQISDNNIHFYTDSKIFSVKHGNRNGINFLRTLYRLRYMLLSMIILSYLFAKFFCAMRYLARTLLYTNIQLFVYLVLLLQRIVPHYDAILLIPDLTMLSVSFLYHKVDSFD